MTSDFVDDEQAPGVGSKPAAAPALSGFLPDREIKRLLNDGHLLAATTWIEKSIRESSYLARVGNEYQLVEAKNNQYATSRTVTQHYMDDGGSLTLRPGDTALLFFEEEFRMPNNVMALTIPRGLLYAQCLAPGVSYVDPGFSGKFYLPVTNISRRSTEIPHNLEIARVLFFLLGQEVEEPFNKEKTRGLATSLVSMPTKPVITDRDIQSMEDDRLADELDEFVAEAIRRAGHRAAEKSTEASRASLIRTLVLAAVLLAWPPLYLAIINPDWRGRLGGWMAPGLAAIGIAVITVLTEVAIKPLLRKGNKDG